MIKNQLKFNISIIIISKKKKLKNTFFISLRSRIICLKKLGCLCQDAEG